MTLTPQITLNINVFDFSGVELGSATQPAYVRIALAGFGPFLPRIPTAGFIGKGCTWPMDIPYTGSQITVTLWGNDVVLPGPNYTYYFIALLDAKRNVIQGNNYQFLGSGTFDLSTVNPYLPPLLPPAVGYEVVAFTPTPIFNAEFVKTFDLTLTADVTSSLLIYYRDGQRVTFLIAQDSVGGHAFAWPPNVKNATMVDPTPNSITSQTFIARAVRLGGDLYPVGPATYN